MIVSALLLVGCVDSEQLGNSLQTNPVEVVAEIEKTQLTIERVVGKFKMVLAPLFLIKTELAKQCAETML